MGKVPRKSLISFGGMDLFFKDGSNIKKIRGAPKSDPRFLIFCKKIIEKYFKAIYLALLDVFGENDANNMTDDTTRNEFMLMSVTSLAAFIRLLERQLLYHEEIRNLFSSQAESSTNDIKNYLLPIFRGIKFKKINWKKERFKSSHWADLEKEMVTKIRTSSANFSSFGDPQYY